MVRGDLDAVYGAGFAEKLQKALLALNAAKYPEIMELFTANRFIATSNDNYKALEDVARGLGMVR